MDQIRNDYIARYEEMLAAMRRKYGEEVYEEPFPRADDGSVLLDEDQELPVRADAANPDGEPFDLDLSDPVPASDELDLDDYHFPIEVFPGHWDAMRVRVKFEESLSEGQWEDLHMVVRSWFLAGFWGAYGGPLHALDELTIGGRTMKFIVDLGTAEVESLHILLNAVSGFAEENSPIEKVDIGGSPE